MKKKYLLMIVFSFFSMLCMAQENTDDIDDEVESEISEEFGTAEKVLDELSDKAKELIKGMIANAIGASPIAEVASLRKVMKESLDRQNKLAKANLELEVEYNKAFLSISKELSTYYKGLKFNDKIRNISSKEKKYNGEVESYKHLSKNAIQLFKKQIGALADVSKITKDIKVVTNQDDVVWMSETERMEVLNICKKKLEERDANMLSLMNIYADANRNLGKEKNRRNKYKNFIGTK